MRLSLLVNMLEAYTDMNIRTYSVTEVPRTSNIALTVHTPIWEIPFNVWRDVMRLSASVSATLNLSNEDQVFVFTSQQSVDAAEKVLAGALFKKANKSNERVKHK